MSSSQGFGPGSPKSFRYPRGVDLDLESGVPRKGRKLKNPHLEASIVMRIRYFYEAHPVAVALILLSFGLSVLILLSVYETRFRTMRSGAAWSSEVGEYPFPNLRNLIMVAGHSIYTSSSCGKTDREDSWFLEPYQKHPGQAATFLAHIKEGVDIASRDEGALLLFSGGETRKDAGPRSEAQSYWAIAESKGWFGSDETVRSRALTEEHARDSFENLLFSVCRFRELTGRYPQNITVVSYDFKEERFAQLHRTALGFPEGRFFFSGLYLYSATESKLTVDTSRGERLHINFDVTFPALPCSLVAVDTMDVSGEQHYDIKHDIIKKRIDHLGTVIESRKDGVGAPKIERPLQKHGGRLDHNEVYCGSCYGSEESDDQCCNSCEEVRDAYRKKGWALTNVESIDQCKREGFVQRLKDEQGEGCNIHGFVNVNKVAGNFHFAPGKSLDQSFNFLQDLLNLQPETYNISHKINKLSFGEEFPGVVNPLDGVVWTQDNSNGLTGMYQYFVKVVPTIYTDIRGRKIYSNQFSVTEHFREAIGYPRPPPGVYFFYEFSPIKVDFTEENTSLLHFLTNICAIVGGIFTVAGIIDSFVYHGHRAIKKKMEIGKLG